MKLLIVEDEEETLSSIVNYLQNHENICGKAPDYFIAEEKLNIHEYDIFCI